jgi:UDP-N-acetylglucosamine acyltransferase
MSVVSNIHPSAVVEGDVDIHPSAQILANCTIIGPVTIGADTVVGPNAVIGTAAQHRDFLRDTQTGRVVIGERCTIREFVSIHKPCANPTTRIGNDVLIMAGATINHDCDVRDHVIITSGVTLAGTVTVMERANLGQGSSYHQRIVVGAGAMIAMNAAVGKNIPPFATYIPGRELRANTVGLDRSSYAADAHLLADALAGNTIDPATGLGAVYAEYRTLAEATPRPMAWAGVTRA